MSSKSSTQDRTATSKLWSCTCYLCERDALWEIGISGEDERVEAAFACEVHARGHLHLAIVLPEEMNDRALYFVARG